MASLFTNKFNVSLKKKLMNCCIWSVAFGGAGHFWTLREKSTENILEVFKCGAGE